MKILNMRGEMRTDWLSYYAMHTENIKRTRRKRPCRLLLASSLFEIMLLFVC